MLWRFALLALAQDPAAAPAPELRVFLDCQSVSCDFDHLRRAIGWVDWVRDRAVADVHVLGTARGAGGGEEVTLAFLGLRAFAGRGDTLRYTTSSTDTDAERRDALTRHLSLGLVPFAARTPIARRLRFEFREPEAGRPVRPQDDPWNYWVFSVGGSASLEGESRQKEVSVDGGVEASRVTEGWKLLLSVFGEYEREESEFDTVQTFVVTRRGWSVDATSVWSVSSHWSAGLKSGAEHSTFNNYALLVQAGPAVEFSVFPYVESSHRRITVLYAAGVEYDRYQDTTIFNRITETRPLHILESSVNFQQPWGNLFGGIGAEQYLDHLAQHRLNVHGGFTFRLFRGLELDVFGEVARVKNQINLAAGELTPEEILAEQRQLGTEYEYDLSVGLRYTFGSIFNNVVNPRF